jgi:glycosyltransferase involved in cell wall biosynthesis
MWYRTLFALLFCYALQGAQEKFFVIFIASYNNIKWYEKNLDSVCMQNYTNYHIIYVDDCSDDGTAQAVEEYSKKWDLNNKITILKNAERHGQLYNLYVTVHCCPNHAIIVTLDGDDWFAHENVLSVLNQVYSDPQVLMTYGQFKEYPKSKIGFCKKIPDSIKKNNAYRYYDWVTSHLRTFYVGLFKEIPVGYFIKKNGFIRSAGDLASMFSMLELSAGNAVFIEEVLYIYNMVNSNNVFRKEPLQQIHNACWVRGREPLNPIAYNPSEIDTDVASTVVHNIHFSFKSVELCEEYLQSLAVGGINAADVIVLCDASSIELESRYKELCAQYNVFCCAVNDACACDTRLAQLHERFFENSYLLLTSDTCRWVELCNLKAGVKLLAQTKALGYSYMQESLDSSDDESLCLMRLYNNAYVWKYAENCGIWHMPYSAHAVLYSFKTIWPVLGRTQAQTVRECAKKLSMIPTLYPDDVGICAAHRACDLNV